MLLLLCSLLAYAAETFTFDPNHSGVFFRVKHFDIGYTYGHFKKVSGTIKVENQPTSLTLSIALDSVDTNNAKRDQHLLSPDFFNAKQFPTIDFESTKITPVDENTFVVTGNLSMHGQTRLISTEMEQVGKGEDPWGNHKIGYETSLTIKRSDFGVDHMLNSVADEVHVMIGFEAIKQ